MIYWLEVNFYLALFFILFCSGKKLLKRDQQIDYARNLISALPLILLLPLIVNFISIETPLPPVMTKVVEVLSQSELPQNFQIVKSQIRDNPDVFNASQEITLDFLLLFLFLGGVGLWLLRFCFSMLILYRLIHNSVVFKKIGKTTIMTGGDVGTPCSFWLFHNYIFLPINLLEKRSEMEMAIAHELQHHRQGDTKKLYLLELIKGIFYLNPFVHLWVKEIHLLQEVDCDTRVILRKHFTPTQYVRTLYKLTKMNSGVIPYGTLAMASFSDLTRRIEMITRKNGNRGLIKRMTLLALSLSFVWQTACATRLNLGLTELSLSEAQDLATSIQSDFPVEVNETVLKWLNHYLGTTMGRAYVLKTRANMVQYENFIKEKLNARGLPKELLAVPFMESGYENDALSTMGARGLWQFIPGTAKKYELIVTHELDERLHVGKATDAAISYYQHLLKIKEFDGDWRLALLAYNTGEGNLKKAIKERGTKNPWAFNDLGDKEYLAKIMAGIILVNNPRKVFSFHPLHNSKRTSKFGFRWSQVRGENHFHKGVDLGIKQGTEIITPLAGVVSEVTDNFQGISAYGNAITINHGNNIETRYFHLKDFKVVKGAEVRPGDIVGTVGSTGISTGPHLHYEVLINGKHVDPEIFF